MVGAVVSVMVISPTGCFLVNSPPVASFTFILSRRDAPCVVDFDASSSYDPDGIIVKYEWNLGDGSSATGGSTSHTYTEVGTYAIDLTVTDDQGMTCSSSEEITILSPYNDNVNAGLQIIFVASPQSYLALPFTIKFDASGSVSDEGIIVSYLWNFGDGSTGRGRSVLHTYPRAGSYTVSLTATDSQGATGSTTGIVQVNMAAGVGGNTSPGASFTVSPSSGTAPLAVSFDASGSSDSDGSIASYTWAFGDGSSGTGITASHTYNTAGTYTVLLSVTDNEGAASNANQAISVMTQSDPVSFTGSGPQVSASFTLAGGLTTFHMEHDGSANFIVWLLDDQDDWVELLVNEIGSFDGSKAIGIDSPGIHLLDIQADGNWTITVEQPAPSSAPSAPQSYAGQGQEFSPFFTLGSGLTTFHMEHDGSANFIVWLLDDQGDRVALPVNEIGSFDGSKAIGIDSPGIHLLDIQGDGNWTITVEQPTPSPAPSPPQTYTGYGQEFSPFFTLGSGLTTFHMEHDGSANFIVWLLDDQGDWVELLVNEIGSFDGSKAIGIDSPGIHLLDIQADGSWTITVEQ